MKKMLNSLVLAAAALGANAQTPPTAAQADIQKRANNTLSIPLGGDAEISTTNTNSKNTTAAAITLGNGPLLRLAADTDSNALAAIGLQIGNNGSLVAGISRARESISGVDANGVAYNTKLSGKSEFFMLNLHNLSPEIRRLSVEAIRKSVSDKHLMTSSKDDTQITVSITHIQQVIDTLDATIYRDTTHTSTKTDTYRTTYNTDARGGRSTLARLGMEIAVGKNGVLTLTASQLQTQLP